MRIFWSKSTRFSGTAITITSYGLDGIGGVFCPTLPPPVPYEVTGSLGHLSAHLYAVTWSYIIGQQTTQFAPASLTPLLVPTFFFMGSPAQSRSRQWSRVGNLVLLGHDHRCAAASNLIENKMIIDLSQVFYDGMPGTRFKSAAGEAVELTARIRPYMTHAQSGQHYQNKASFEITDVAFQSSVGTKMDAPRHRFEGAEDIASLELNRLVLDGVVIDARRAQAGQRLDWKDLAFPKHLAGRAVLLNFGWDRHWGTERYRSHPFVSREVLTKLYEAEIALFGVDCSNADSTDDAERPAHTWFLKRGILIVENLTGLSRLHGAPFRFFSIPLKAQNAAAFPVRAFAEVRE